MLKYLTCCVSLGKPLPPSGFQSLLMVFLLSTYHVGDTGIQQGTNKILSYEAYLEETHGGHHCQSPRQPPKVGIIRAISQVGRLSFISKLVAPEETIPSHLVVPRAQTWRAVHMMLQISEICKFIDLVWWRAIRVFLFTSSFTF